MAALTRYNSYRQGSAGCCIELGPGALKHIWSKLGGLFFYFSLLFSHSLFSRVQMLLDCLEKKRKEKEKRKIPSVYEEWNLWDFVFFLPFSGGLFSLVQFLETFRSTQQVCVKVNTEAAVELLLRFILEVEV